PASQGSGKACGGSHHPSLVRTFSHPDVLLSRRYLCDFLNAAVVKRNGVLPMAKSVFFIEFPYCR
ncbi:MAG: hypothetical protein QXI12_11030, partial [Candidatus Methanomethyliaceae archaeon]